LFEIGDGSTSSNSDALVVYKNGNAAVQGNVTTGGNVTAGGTLITGAGITANGIITAQPGGSIPMYTGQ